MQSTVVVEALRVAAGPLSAVLPQAAWLPHRLVRLANGRLDKPPCEGAVSNRPETWVTLDKALELLISRPHVAGIGFAICAGIISLDYDHCRDPVTGALHPAVAEELERFNSFAYVTPSGTGIRIVGLNGSAIPGGKRVRVVPGGLPENDLRVEIFIGPTNHYNTITGDVLAGYETLRDISDETLDYLAGLPERQLHAGERTQLGEPSEPGDGRASDAAVAAALAVMANREQNWGEWSRIGMAAWRASGGSEAGFAAWVGWSAKHPCHDPAACLERWQHWFKSPPTQIGFGTLYYLARQERPLFVPPFGEAGGEHPAGDTAGEGWDQNEKVGDKRPPFAAKAFDPDLFDSLAPRQWVYGHFLIRRFCSVLGAPGGTGKTAYAMAVALSVALGRPLLGEAVHEAGPVWVYNLEDPEDEIYRRLWALCRHHKIATADLDGRLFVNSGRDQPLIVARSDGRGGAVMLPVVRLLVAELVRCGVRLLVIDPFVKSHALEENRNDQIDFAASLWSQVAEQAGCAILLLHHFRKGGASGEADAFRGASALVDAARAAVTLATMGVEEAAAFGLNPGERRAYVRVDNAKLNLARPPDETLWLRMVSVDLPNGDAVQAVERWEPPSLWEGVPMAALVRILDRITAGPGGGEQFSLHAAAAERWAGTLLVAELRQTPAQAKRMLKDWVRSGLLKATLYKNAKRMEATGCEVDAGKLAEMRQATRAEPRREHE